MPKLANPTQPMRYEAIALKSDPVSLLSWVFCLGGGNWDFIFIFLIIFFVELGVLNVFHMVPSSSHQVPNGYLLFFFQ
jgi:hypothetical protein